MKRIQELSRIAVEAFSIIRTGFWFIDIPRTSSSSLRIELGNKFGKVYGKGSMTNEKSAPNQVLPYHLPARNMRSILTPFFWNRLYTFSIVRNPWSRTFSMFNYRKRVSEIPDEWDFRRYILELNEAIHIDEPDNFSLFRYHAYRFAAADYVQDENGNIIVDFIAKYETRLDDLREIASRIGCEELGDFYLNRSASPEGLSYRKAYDSETRNIIGDIYANDVDLFGYEF